MKNEPWPDRFDRLLKAMAHGEPPKGAKDKREGPNDPKAMGRPQVSDE